MLFVSLRVFPISGNTQSVCAIAGSHSHILCGLQDPHSSWPTSFGSLIISSLLLIESRGHHRCLLMQTSVSFSGGPIVLPDYPEPSIAVPADWRAHSVFNVRVENFYLFFSSSKDKVFGKNKGRFWKKWKNFLKYCFWHGFWTWNHRKRSSFAWKMVFEKKKDGDSHVTCENHCLEIYPRLFTAQPWII